MGAKGGREKREQRRATNDEEVCIVMRFIKEVAVDPDPDHSFRRRCPPISHRMNRLISSHEMSSHAFALP